MALELAVRGWHPAAEAQSCCSRNPSWSSSEELDGNYSLWITVETRPAEDPAFEGINPAAPTVGEDYVRVIIYHS